MNISLCAFDVLACVRVSVAVRRTESNRRRARRRLSGYCCVSIFVARFERFEFDIAFEKTNALSSDIDDVDGVLVVACPVTATQRYFASRLVALGGKIQTLFTLSHVLGLKNTVSFSQKKTPFLILATAAPAASAAVASGIMLRFSESVSIPRFVHQRRLVV